MPVYYNPGSCFNKIKSYSPAGQTSCSQADYWAAAEGSVVPAAADGIVYIADKGRGNDNRFGYYVVLEHTKKEEVNGQKVKVYTIYAHLGPKLEVRGTQSVRRGDPLGYVGNSGSNKNVPGVKSKYFHFEIRDADYWIGPGKTWRDINTVNPATFDLSQLMGIDETDTKVYASPSCKADTANTNRDADTEAIDAICTTTACTEDQFIVQIMGIDHPEGQRVILVDDKNNEISPDSIDTIKKTDQSLLSTLHQWDWCKLECKKNKLKAYLEIKTSNNPIRILISEKIEQTPKQTDKQINQIVPLVPITLVDRATHFNIDSGNALFVGAGGVPVVSRPGYLYIYKGDILIREIQIIEKDNNTLAFKDVPIEQYRTLNLYKEGKREATGIELSEIWLPSCWNNTDIPNISFMYSEVQLSAARLNLFAIDDATFARHPKTTLNKLSVEQATQARIAQNIAKGEELLKSFSAYSLGIVEPVNYTSGTDKARDTIKTIKNTIVSTNMIAPHRKRNVLLEMSLDNPAGALYRPNFFNQAVNSAKQFEESNQKGAPDYFNITGRTGNARLKLREVEFGAWSHQLQQTKQTVQQATRKIINTAASVSTLLFNKEYSSTHTVADKTAAEAPTFSIASYINSPLSAIFQGIANAANQSVSEPEPIQKSIWDSPPEFENILQDAQAREIYCVYVDDLLFTNRHLTTNITSATEQLRQVVEQTANNTYFDSALIIQKVIACPTINGQVNPLWETYETQNNKKNLDKNKLAIACCATGRAALVTKYSEIQTKLVQQFQDPAFQEILADHLSQDNTVHYAAAYLSVLQSLQSLAMPPNQLDPYLSPDHAVYHGTKKITNVLHPEQGLGLLANLVQTLDSRLHKMLFKPVDLEAATHPLKKQDITKVTPNLGNGYIRPHLLQQCIYNKAEVTEEDTNTLDAALLALTVKADKLSKTLKADKPNTTLKADNPSTIVKDTADFGKSLLGILAGALSNIDNLIKHWDDKLKIANQNDANLRTQINEDIARVRQERKILGQQAQAIEENRAYIQAEGRTADFNQERALAEAETNRITSSIEENNRVKAQIRQDLPQMQAEADKAREIQALEAEKTAHQENIKQLNEEINELKKQRQPVRDQAKLAEIDNQIATKSAELEKLQRNPPTNRASQQGNAHINAALANNTNNGQARVGNVTLHELPIKLWRVVMFDHTRHVLGGLISEAYIAPFSQRAQGAGNNLKGILIRFAYTPQATAVLKELYGDSIDIDYERNASTNRGKLGGQTNVNTRPDFLGVFAPEGSDLYEFVNALEQEALQGQAEEFANASTSKKVEIAENYRNRAQAELDTRRNNQQALNTEIQQLQAEQKVLQTKVDNARNEYGRMLEAKEAQVQIDGKLEQLNQAKDAVATNTQKINELTADLNLEGTYQHALQALIEKEQATIDKLNALGEEGKELSQQQAESVKQLEAIETKRKQQLAAAETKLESQIQEHSETVAKQGQKPDYNALRERLATSDADIANARQRLNTNTINRTRLERLVDNHAFRGLVLGFQIYNLYGAITSFKKMQQDRGEIYANITWGAAAANLALAAEDVVAQASKQHMNAFSSFFRTKVFFNIPERFIPKFLAASSKVVLNLKVTGMVFAQAALSVVAVGLSVSDLWYSINEGDKSIIIAAKGLAVLASLAGLASVFVGGATFLLLNPLGWAALIATLIAFGIVYYFSHEPLEAWLKFGPFATQPEAYLQDPIEAFYRLVGIYADIQISIERNPNVKRSDTANRISVECSQQLNKGSTTKAKFIKIPAGLRICITSQLNGLMATDSDSLAYNTHIRVKAKHGWISEEINQLLQSQLTTVVNDLPNGKEYLIDDIEELSIYTAGGMGMQQWLNISECNWLVASQLVTQYHGKYLAFPALRANNDESNNYIQASLLPYSVVSFTRDTFGKTRQLFWANETTHLVASKTAAATATKSATSGQPDTTLSSNVSMA